MDKNFLFRLIKCVSETQVALQKGNDNTVASQPRHKSLLNMKLREANEKLKISNFILKVGTPNSTLKAKNSQS